MKQEFVTLYGKLVVERDVLYFRQPYLPFEKTAFAQISYEILWILIFVSRIFAIDSSMDTMVTIVFGILVASRFPYMYDKFLKRSFASRIPLSSIRDFSCEEDPHGLQMDFKLLLKNGRYKKITFRKLEGQVENFTSLITSSAQRFAVA